MPGAAKVSCILLARNRRRLTNQAIWYFLREEHPNRELIIVDDGEESVADLVPDDPRVRYVRLPQRRSLASRRNVACELSTGDWIAHWDNDSWFAPNRLRWQMEQMQVMGGTDIEIAGLANVLHYEPQTGKIWRYVGTAQPSAGIHMGSLLYRRSYWHSHPFPEGTAAAEKAFLSAAPAGRLAILDGSSLVVAIVHGGSSVTPNPVNPQWQPRPFHELSAIIDADLASYTKLNHNTPTQSRRLTPLPVTLAATFMVYDGYGSMAEYLALGMARSGVDLHILPLRIDPAAMSEEFQTLWRNSKPNPQGIVLCHAWWGENLARFGGAKEIFIKSVWETSRLPADWPARLNQMSGVIVPSHFAARVFRESGVTVPVEVVHEGIDPAVYSYHDRGQRTGHTTLIVSVLTPRKNVREAIAAWKLAFADDPEARLIIKSRFQIEPYVPDDPRICFIDNNEATRGIAHWYHQADLLLALGNEGFGLPLVEGMATGLPVVALNSEAQADICAEAAEMLLPVEVARWEKVKSEHFGACGVRAIPSVEDAARQLRWAARHRDEAQAMGHAASEWAQQRRNIWEMGPAVVEIMEHHIRSPQPLRRTCALWAPRNAEWFDASFYAAQLARTTKLTKIFEQAPRTWRAQLLHIQHTPASLAAADLARQVELAQQNGIAVAGTVHVVGDQAEAWEQRADLLIALTARGAERLKARWKQKRVEFLPPAFPRWRPSSRPGGGRTLAVIGSPSKARGAEALVEAMADLPNATLLIFGAPPTGEEGMWWQASTQKLAVVWSDLPATDEELVCQLGARADAVVFWHEESRYEFTSYATRIAMASGVPLLCSQAREFGELAGAIYQPPSLANGLEELFVDRSLAADLGAAARTMCEAHSWERVAAQHHALWQTLC